MSDLASYQNLLARKRIAFEPRGIAKVPALNAAMFPHQAHTTEFLLRSGCGAAFLDTGLGKSLVALEWGRVIAEYANKPVLMLAPLAVGPQHAREAEKFGIEAGYFREPPTGKHPPIVITNYERVDKFDLDAFAGVILDESSILKSFTGATTRKLIEAFKRTPYRLACTATPAPNDHMELGQHAEFLGVMASNEMLARWFISDQAQMGRYRLKKPAVGPFWDWVASWSHCIATPSDIGLEDAGFELPELVTRNHVVNTDLTIEAGETKRGQALMFRETETSATSIHREKRLTVKARADAVAAVVTQEAHEPWVIWVDTDYEADAIMARLPGAVEVRGSMKPDVKEERLVGFSNGEIGMLVSKPRICGYGLNWQHCARTAFVGLSFSYEAYYQALRRFWRFGQKRAVHAHVAMSDTERAIWDAVSRKSTDHERMKTEMRGAMSRAVLAARVYEGYEPTRRVELPDWVRAA